MNIITETVRRLKYQESKIEELQECLDKCISVDATRYISDEITKAEKNLEYYYLVLEKMEGN